jgi:hypothetical protein
VHWTAFALMVVMFILVAIVFENKKWIGNALQTLGSIAGVYATILVFIQTKQGSDEQFKKQIEHLQLLNYKQIEALQLVTEKQITELQILNSKQIEVLQNSTEKQINALAENTNKQILTYTIETKKIVDELTDNSVLLGEILKRELEKGILQTDQQIQEAEVRLNALRGFVFGRTEIEKARQLREHNSLLEWLKNWRARLHNKYQLLLKEFKD